MPHAPSASEAGPLEQTLASAELQPCIEHICNFNKYMYNWNYILTLFESPAMQAIDISCN